MNLQRKACNSISPWILHLFSTPREQKEEDEFAQGFAFGIKKGLFALPKGKSLRDALAERLRCPPMRVARKYKGLLGGKDEGPPLLAADVEEAHHAILGLERRF